MEYFSNTRVMVEYEWNIAKTVRHTFLVRCIESSNLSIPELKYTRIIVGLGRLELPTSRLSGVHSNR